MMTFWSILALAVCGALVVLLGVAFERALKWGEREGIVDRSSPEGDKQ